MSAVTGLTHTPEVEAEHVLAMEASGDPCIRSVVEARCSLSDLLSGAITLRPIGTRCQTVP
jgi:hypothetical protein